MVSASEHPLDDWQARLAERFDDVTLRKLELPQEPVTFALEHGLSESERSELQEAIEASMRFSRLYPRHFVCWAVHAAEIGYLFSGDEFWHTFEERTPNWSNTNRPFIKSAFRSFSEAYNGAIPKGPWAQHRSIICWPITHSILPKDLQRQLAEILYRIRHSVVIEDVESPRQLGRLIARQSANATSRFQQLCSEPDLIGQIAAALLLDDQNLNLIESRTLKRIAEDLMVEEQARSWLHGARSHLSQRAQLKGLSRRPRTTDSIGESYSQPPKPPIRPRMLLRADQRELWRLVFEVPDLTPLVRTYPELQPVFSRSRVRVGMSQRPAPARSLLHGSQSFAQPSWPSVGQPMLSFVPSGRDLDALIAHSCAVKPSPWLFRIGADGIAREILSKRIATDGEYLLVGDAEQLGDARLGEFAEIDCEGVICRHLAVENLELVQDLLTGLGLSVARKIHVWPVGLVPADWDREGTIEWLSTDRPTIGISANYAIDRYELSVNVGVEDLAATVRPHEPTASAFFQLPELRAGIYHLSVKAHAVDPRFSVEPGDLEIYIRDPVPTDAHATGRLALMVTEEPPGGTLEEFFEGRLQIQAIGPSSREVTATIRLLSRRKIKPLAEVTLSGIHLPMTSEDWNRRVAGVLDKDLEFSRAYQEANSCELRIDGDDLGVHISEYDRPVVPLRWGVTHARDEWSIMLFDDSEDPQGIEVIRYDFDAPSTQTHVTDRQLAQAEIGRAKPGLYVARAGSFIASTIVPVKSLESLWSTKPRFRKPDRTPETVLHLLDSIDDWGHVSTIGNVFGRYAWRQSLKALVQQMVGLIGGTDWYKAELSFSRSEVASVRSLADHIPYKQFGRGWEASLVEAIDHLSEVGIDERVAILSRIVASSSDECRFALQMASDPTDIRLKYENRFGYMLNRVMFKSQLIRAARFVVLAISEKLQDSDSDQRALYEGWAWN